MMSLTQEEIYTAALQSIITRGYGQLENVKHLISLGAIPNRRCIENGIENGSVDVLKYLVEEYGYVLEKDNEEFYLIKACKHGYGYTVDYLAKRSSEKTLAVAVKYTIKQNLPLMILQTLMEIGLERYEGFMDRSEALYFATIYNHVPMWKWLQEKGAKPTAAIRNLGR